MSRSVRAAAYRVWESDLVIPQRIAYLGPVRKLVPFFFLLILLTQLAGYYGYFGFRLYAIHEKAREALRHLPAESLHQLRLARHEFLALGDDGYREFEWNDRMYDVARVEISGDEALVFALPDEAEDDLLSFLKAVTENASKDHQPTPNSFISFLSLSFLCTDTDVIPNPEAMEVIHCTCCNTSYTSPELASTERPPLA